MSATIQGQQTYTQFPVFGLPGQIVDCEWNEIESFIAVSVINPGAAVELASDGLSVQMCQQTGSTLAPLGVALLETSREGNGAFNIQAYGVGGAPYQIGDTVPVLRRGKVYGLWAGTTQTAYSLPNIKHSSTTPANQGVFTDASPSSGAGTEVTAAPHTFQLSKSLPGTGSVCMVTVNMPGAS